MQDSAQVVRREMVREHVALVTIDRPGARNAINRQVAEQMAQIVIDLEADDTVRVVILTGAGDLAFCAGADLKEVAQGGLSALFVGERGLAGLSTAPRRKIWVAAVNGHAHAGGFELALSCDMIVASTSATFSLPEVKRSLVAGASGSYRLVRTLPRNIAVELIATGRVFGAQDANRWNMVNRLTSPETLLDEAIGLAEEIAANAPIAVYESLIIARQAFDLTDAELSALCDEALTTVMATEDFAEGPRAFIEKRAPRWKGR